MFGRTEPAKPFKLIYDSGQFGKQEFDFTSCPEAMDWKRQNPPGQLVRTVYLQNLSHYNVFVPEIQTENNHALFLHNFGMHPIANESFSQEAYNKAVEDKEWDEVYFRKTGKHWQSQGEHQDETKAPPETNSEVGRLDLEGALRILGLRPGFSKDSLKKAYNKAVKMNHPDKAAHLDIEFRELAERKTKQINQAYALLKRTIA